MRRFGIVVVLLAGLVSSVQLSLGSSVERVLRLREAHVARAQALPVVPQLGLAPARSRLHLVFLSSWSTPAQRRALQNAGAKLRAYLPDDVYAVEIDAERLPALRALKGVIRVESFPPWYRLSSELQSWILSPGRAKHQAETSFPLTRRLRVVAFGWGEKATGSIAVRARRVGARVLAWHPKGDILEVEATRWQALALARSDEVSWIDLATPSETDMDIVRQSTGASWLETVSGYCGQGVRGEVFDAGIEAGHQDFDGVMLHGPHDQINHGTSTYGIVFGNGRRDGDGDTRATGMLPCAEQGIFADKDEVSDRYAHTEELLSHPYFASFQTNSWGHRRTLSYTSYSHEIDDIIWRLDIPLVQSQSNSGSRLSRPEAWAKNVISVGGILHKNTLDTSDDRWGGVTSIGPAEDGRIKPDLCYWADHVFTTTNGGYRPDFNGTSAATPQVAGVLGLLLEMWSEDVWGTHPIGGTVFERRPHAATVKALLINSAQQYDFTGTTDDLTRTHQGWGRPSAQLAKERARRSLIVDQAVHLQLGAAANYEIEVQAGASELRVTMVYPDPPGTLSASVHRINDLDLRVRSPSGTLYNGNHGLDVGRYSILGGSADRLNTVENVFVAWPEAGHWQVEVVAKEINQDGALDTTEDDAVFALVVSGARGAATCAGGAAPLGLVATSPANQRVDLSWDPAPGAIEYRVYRSAEDCTSGFVRVGVTSTTRFIDKPVSGGAPRHYLVRAINDCGGVSAPSSCVSVTPGGACTEPPRFAGLEQVVDLKTATCTLELSWNPAEARCGGDLRYNVYRSGAAEFTPGPGNLAASCLRGTSWSDSAVSDAKEAFYVVRAEDLAGGGDGPCASGFAEKNLVRRSAVPTGPDTVFYQDLFEDSSGWTLENEWEIAAPQGLGGSILGGPDPAFAAQGSRVLGLDLSGLGDFPGNYERMIDAHATSPEFDASGHAELWLRYWRWLCVEAKTSDVATVEVFDGSVWRLVWSNPAATISHRSWGLEQFNLSELLSGVTNARIRFGLESSFNRHYCGWNIDQIEVFEPQACVSGAIAPPPVPDGKFAPGTPMSSSRSQSNGTGVDVSWDVSSCPANAYHLFYGPSDELASYRYTGAVCDLPAGGRATVAIPNPTPGKVTWWLIAGADGATEGGHGYRSTGRLRNATGVGWCGLTAQDHFGSCP